VGVEAEQAVLGLMLSGSDQAAALASCSPDLFSHPWHRQIFERVAALIRQKKAADVVTVFERLRDDGLADDVGGLSYLNEVALMALPSARGHQYVELLQAHALRRKLAVLAESGGDLAALHKSVSAALAEYQAPPTESVGGPRTLDFRALADQRAPERTWFRPGWLGPGPTLLAGSGGSGKSTLVQQEATAAAMGRPYFTEGHSAYTSLVLNCEDGHDEMWLRQEGICSQFEIPLRSLAGRLHLVSRYGCDNALMASLQGQLVPTRLLAELREQVNDERIDVLWLDNAAHFFLGDHDNRTEVTQFINALNGLVHGRPFAVVIVAHPGKGVGSEYSGSVAWENAVRMRWYLGASLPNGVKVHEDSGQDDSVAYLSKRKSNYSAKDYVRFERVNGLLIPEVVTEQHGLARAQVQQRCEQVLIDAYRRLREMGLFPSDARNARDYLPRAAIDKQLALGFSREDLQKAMHRLMSRGVFVRGVVGKRANRLPVEGLQLSEEAQTSCTK
jgi:hypothetical protein